MPVNRSGLPLFAGTEDTEDMFLTTMENVDSNVANLLKIHHPLYAFLKAKNLIKYKSDIGTEIVHPLLVKANTTVKSMTGYDDVDLTPQEALDGSKFTWGHIVGTQMYSREEMTKNSGKQKIIDLSRTKTTQLEESIDNFFAAKLMGSQAADGRDFVGLARVMTTDAVIGGIDPSVTGNEYWNPQIAEASAGVNYTMANLRKGRRALSMKCSLNGSVPQVHFVGEDVYHAYCDELEGKIQLTEKEAGAYEGFDILKVSSSQVMIYEPTLNAKELWAMDFDKGVNLNIHKGTNFAMQPWEQTAGKVAKHRNCLLYANISVPDRRRLGRATFT